MGFAALVGSDGPHTRLVGAVSMGICSFGRQFWASFGGSRVYGYLQLWSAVIDLVCWEPGFAALVGSDGSRLVGAVSMQICSFGRK